MGLRRVFGIAAIAALGTACSTDCTEIGCLAGINIEFANRFAVEQLPLTITTCADDECSIEQIARDQAAPGEATIGLSPTIALDEQSEKSVDVTVEVRSAETDEVLVAARGTAHLKRSQPNGDGCGPVCYGAQLVFEGTDDRLVQR